MIPLRNIWAETVAKVLAILFSRVGFPKQVVTDLGTDFMSNILQAMWHFLGVQPLQTSVYHPQTKELVERFNRTLKHMLQNYVAENGLDWSLWLPFLLFAIRLVPQVSQGLSLFELLFR